MRLAPLKYLLCIGTLLFGLMFAFTFNRHAFTLNQGSLNIPGSGQWFNVDPATACGCNGFRCQKKTLTEYLEQLAVPEAKCIAVQVDGSYLIQNVAPLWKELVEGLSDLKAFRSFKAPTKKVSIDSWLRSLCFSGYPDAIVMLYPGVVGSEKFSDNDWNEIKKISPVFLLIDDLHYNNIGDGHTKVNALRRAEEILGTAVYLLPHWYPSIKTDWVWLPNAAGKSFLFHEINGTAKNDVVVSGHTQPKYYPCRFAAAKLAASGVSGFSLIPHPDPLYQGRRQKTSKYADILRQHRFGLATTSLNYVVGKVFEIPAVGTAVIINKDLRALLTVLGFQRDVNYFEFDCTMPLGMSNPEGSNNLQEVYESLRSSHLVEDVRIHGQQLIHERHTVTHRVWQVAARIMRVIEKKFRLKRSGEPDHFLGKLSDAKLENIGRCFVPPQKIPHEWPHFLTRV